MKRDGCTKWLLNLVAIVIVLSGCVSNPTIRVENMIPPISHLQAQVSDRTLKVRDVTGGARLPTICCMYDEVKIDNAHFQEALLKSLTHSKLFKDVITSGDADYELMAEIAAQHNAIVGVLTYGTHLLINYYLVDRRTNKELWSEHVFSQHTEKASPAQALEALLKMNEGAVKENLSQFVMKLSSFVDRTANQSKE